MDDQSNFSAATTEFWKWLGSNGATVSTKIELADLRSKDCGRGVIAIQDVEDEEDLFTIPKASILSVENSALPKDVTGNLNDPWQQLILAMIYEQRRGQDSPLKPYFDVLPIEFDTLMFWSDEELSWLRGSAVLDKIGKSTATATFEHDLLPILRAHAEDFKVSGLPDDQIIALCHRMGSTIMAYAFDLEQSPPASEKPEEDGWEEDDEDSETLPKGMVPLADMLNADADRNNAKLYHEDDRVVMRAIKRIKAGEEIFNDYGPLPTADLLRRYGYVTDNYARYDVVEVSCALINRVAQEQLRLKAEHLKEREAYLDDQGVLEDGYDIARLGNPDDPQFPEELCMLLNLFTMEHAEFERLRKKEKLPKPQLSAMAGQLLTRVLEARRAMYPDGNGKARDAVENSPRAMRRLAMASQVIKGELQVIEEAFQTLQSLETAGNNATKRSVDEHANGNVITNGTNKKQKR